MDGNLLQIEVDMMGEKVMAGQELKVMIASNPDDPDLK